MLKKFLSKNLGVKKKIFWSSRRTPLVVTKSKTIQQFLIVLN